MFDWLFGKKTKDWVGIDLGASAIKVVEIKKTGQRLALSNYALLQIADGEGKQGELSNEEIAVDLKILFERAGITSRRVNISLPIGKTFSTIVEFPAMSEAELAAAVPYEARKYIPVPMEEVVLDWSVVGETRAADGTTSPLQKEDIIPPSGGAGGDATKGDLKKEKAAVGTSPLNLNNPTQPPLILRGGEEGLSFFDIAPSTELGTSRDKSGPGTGLQVLLVAVPKEIIDKLTQITALAGLQINAMEQEAFSLARALVGNDQNTFLVVDVGRKSSDIVVVDGGFVRLSHNFESVNKEVLLMEIDRLVNVFKVKYNKNIGACLLTGGRAQEKALFEFLTAKLRLPTALGNPFARLEFPPALEPALKELGSMLSVAAGLAMREN